MVFKDAFQEILYQPLEQSDVKELIHDALNELQRRENIIPKERPRSNNER
jgi:hypothetical protein